VLKEIAVPWTRWLLDARVVWEKTRVGLFLNDMIERRLALGVIFSFVGLCALALWLTRPVDEPTWVPGPRDSVRNDKPSLPDFPRPPPERRAPAGGTGPSPSLPPAPPPGGEAPEAARHPEALPERVAARAPGQAGPPPAPTTLSEEDVRGALEGIKPLVRECFEDAAQRYPGPQRVVLKFTLEGQGLRGRILEGEVAESTVTDPWLQACFLDALTDARFPPPHGTGTLTVRYPFRYEPSSDGGTPAAGRQDAG